MQRKETYEIAIDGVDIAPEQLKEQIKNLVRHDVERLGLQKEIQEAINRLVSEFLKQEYTEEDLTTEIKYKVNVFENGYRLSIYVYVYPLQHSDVSKFKNVLLDLYVYFMHADYTKIRNELGLTLKTNASVYYKLVQLQRENEELKTRLERAENRIKELEEKLEEEQQEEEL
jgi:hypothetical protein